MTNPAAICLLLFVSCVCLTYSGGAAQVINNYKNDTWNQHTSLYYYYPPAVLAIPDLRLQTGDSFTVQGTPDKWNSRFDINFQKTNSTADSNIPLHIKVQMYHQTTVFGARENGKWTIEQKKPLDFPFTAGELFDVKVVLRDDYYDVFVNSKPYYKFYHVISSDVAHYFHLAQDAEFSMIKVEYFH